MAIPLSVMAMLGQGPPAAQEELPPVPAPQQAIFQPQEAQAITPPPLSAKSFSILAKTAWDEARGEGEAGMKAVLHVLKNRAEAEGTDPAEEALKPKQFSGWNDPKRLKKLKDTDKRLKEARRLTKVVFSGEDEDPTKGATHFHASSVDPYWKKAMKKTATIGKHFFYVPRGR